MSAVRTNGQRLRYPRAFAAWGLLIVAFAMVAGCGAAKPRASAVATAPAVVMPQRARATSDAAVARLIIPSIAVDRAVTAGTVDEATRTMVAPAGPFDIAYYAYSARPGRGNAVFSGHVDYHDVGPAVFWNLEKLRENDTIVVRLADGFELRYAVRFNKVYDDAAGGEWQELFGPLATVDGITVYTCAGDFDPQAHAYDKRRVVRAERVA